MCSKLVAAKSMSHSLCTARSAQSLSGSLSPASASAMGRRAYLPVAPWAFPIVDHRNRERLNSRPTKAMPRTRKQDSIRRKKKHQPLTSVIHGKPPFRRDAHQIVAPEAAGFRSASSPSLASAESSPTRGPRTALASSTSPTTPSSAERSSAISARCRRTSSCSSAFWLCVVCSRALSWERCAARAGAACAARMDVGGRRCGLFSEAKEKEN